MHVRIITTLDLKGTHPRYAPIIEAAEALEGLDVTALPWEDKKSPKIEIYLSGEGSWLSVTARCEATSADIAVDAVTRIYDAACGDGHRMLTRVAPKSETMREWEIDFDHHRGFCRFSVGADLGDITLYERKPGEQIEIAGYGERP